MKHSDSSSFDAHQQGEAQINAMGDHKNPWGNGGGNRGGSGGGGRGGSPWGSGNGGGGDMPPDLDELLRKAQKNLNDVLPGNFGGGKMISLVILVVIGLWAATGFYTLQPSQHGVVTTFGKYTRTQEQPGLQYRMPWPIQDATVVDVENERRIQIGAQDYTRRNFSNSTSAQSVKSESLMLTGDENIIDIDFVVLWKISSAKDFLFKIRDPESTIRIVAESAMREVIGRTDIQPALTDARGTIQSDTRRVMQRMLDDYEAGVEINGVQLQKVDPPQPVVDAFNEVQRARQEKEQLKNQAEAYLKDIIPRARGEAEKQRQAASAYKAEVMNRAQGDAERFASVYAAYKESKDVTAKRIYLETLEQILQKTNNIIIDPSQKGSNVLPYLPLDKMKKQ
ncbi:MAG: FtsH protease activity modulator HflK [Alphaproteobacteria bacterium]